MIVFCVCVCECVCVRERERERGGMAVKVNRREVAGSLWCCKVGASCVAEGKTSVQGGANMAWECAQKVA